MGRTAGGKAGGGERAERTRTTDDDKHSIPPFGNAQQWHGNNFHRSRGRRFADKFEMLERHIDKVVTEAKMANPSSKTKEKFRKQERLLLQAHHNRKENADNHNQQNHHHQHKQQPPRESPEKPDGIYEKSKPKPKLILSNGKCEIKKKHIRWMP